MTPPSDQDEHASRQRPAPRPGGSVPPPSTAPRLRLALPADWVAPSVARDRLDRWLRGLGWPASQREDLVLAVSEAVSNSVEHGYGVSATAPSWRDGVVEVEADLWTGTDGTRRVLLTVRDRGRWREPAAAPHRGHGLSMIRAGGDDVAVDGGPRGTTVRLTSRAAPPVRPGWPG